MRQDVGLALLDDPLPKLDAAIQSTDSLEMMVAVAEQFSYITTDDYLHHFDQQPINFSTQQRLWLSLVANDMLQR